MTLNGINIKTYKYKIAFQDTVKSETTEEKISPVAIGKQLEYLQHQLSDLHLEKLLGPETSIDLSDPQGALQKYVISSLF